MMHAVSTPLAASHGRALPRAPFPVARFFYLVGCALVGVAVIRATEGGSQPSDWIFLIAIAAALVETTINRESIRPRIPVGIVTGVLAYVLGTTLSALTYGDLAEALPTVARVVFLGILWLWVGGHVLRRPEHVRTAIILWIFSVALSSAAALLQFGFGDIIAGSYYTGDRMSGLARHPNDLGGAIAVVAAPLVALITCLNGRYRWLFGLGLVLIASGLTLTSSLGGMIAAGASVIAWLAITRRITGRQTTALLALVVVAQVLFGFQEERGFKTLVSRLTGQFSGETRVTTVDLRVEANRETWQRISEDPWIGRGLGVAGMTVKSGEMVHNMFLAVWVDAGIIGLIGVLLICWSTALLALRTQRRWGDTPFIVLASSLAASAVASLMFAQAAPILFQRFAWMPIGFLAALASVEGPVLPGGLVHTSRLRL